MGTGLTAFAPTPLKLRRDLAVALRAKADRVPARHRYVDWARGIAVLLMIEAHTADAWTRPADRETLGFRDLTILGGFAAPLFLWLAGLSVVLSASRTAAKTGSRAAAVDAVCRRGLEIFILAFLFRLQAFVISPGSPLVTLFRVDILNVMGPAIVAAGLLWGSACTPAARTSMFAAIAAAIALATPPVRESTMMNALPTWIQWYLRPAGEHTTFTLLPWAGFVFAGGAVGVLVEAASRRDAIGRLHALLAAAGAALVGLGFYAAAQPALFAHASFWTSSPTFFAIRVGMLMVVLSALFAIDRWTPRPRHQAAPSTAQTGWLARLGQTSLFVYWIHVELVYGYATWPIHRALPVAGTIAGCVCFSALMYRAVVIRDALAVRWRARSGTAPAFQAAREGAAS